AEKGADDEWAKELNANKDWGITRSNSPSVLSEDSLEQISAVLISVSELNKLNHRSVPQLKRYLEAGGGGIVAIRDTVLAGKGWPWLEPWLGKEDGGMFRQDKGGLAIVARDASPGEMEEAIAYAIGKNYLPGYEDAVTVAVPDSSRYIREVLAESLDEPLQM